MRRRHRVLIAILFLAGLLVACGPAATSRATPPPAVQTVVVGGTPQAIVVTALPAPTMAPREARAEEGYAAGLVAAQPQPLERMVIRTAQMTLIVEDVEATLPGVNDMVKQMEGYIVQSSSYRTSTDRLAATITLRVPAARFDEAMSRLRAMAGKVQAETISGDDVTDQYVDAQSRLKALQATETELLALLGEVRSSSGNAQQKAQAILDIYNRLTEIRSQIEQIQGQMNYLEQMSAMATITVELLPREAEVVQPVVEEGYDPLRILSRAARSLVQVLEWLLNALIWFAVVLLPILLIVALPVLLIVWLVRRRKRGKVAQEK